LDVRVVDLFQGREARSPGIVAIAPPLRIGRTRRTLPEGDAASQKKTCPNRKESTHFFSPLAGNPKQRMLGPMAIATNCLPPTAYVIGDALFSPLVVKCHRVLPFRSSMATKSPPGSP